jgi:hypothetical protein
LAGAFGLAWRRYWVDALASLALFVLAAIAAGRIWRFPVADEVATIVPLIPSAFRSSTWALARFYLQGGDIHPPTIFLFFSTLYALGIGEAALHLCSLAMTAAALALWQLLTLAMIGRHDEGAVRPTTRLVSVLLFGLTPLAIGQGDAIRWYAQFALAVALFATLYLAAKARAARLASAIPLGVAASINLIAPLVVIPLAIHRYLLERAWQPSFDAAYWAIFALFASPGLYSAVFIAKQQFDWLRHYQFGASPLVAGAADILGFFGGNAIGVGHAWVLLPVIVLAACAIVSLIDRRERANPIHLCLLLLGAMVPAALAGFWESRSFLYLAPVQILVLTVFIDRILQRDFGLRAILVTACAILASIVAIGDLASGTHPFKRTAAVPYRDVIEFVERNDRGDSLVVSFDPVASWELAAQGTASQRCIRDIPGREPACFAERQHAESIFVIGAPSGPYQSAYWRRESGEPVFAARLAKIIGARTKVGELQVGHDEDAALKTWLTGVPLDEFILAVDLYR